MIAGSWVERQRLRDEHFQALAVWRLLDLIDPDGDGVVENDVPVRGLVAP